MKLRIIQMAVFGAALFWNAGVQGQSGDALLKKLVEKGVLTQREANEIREEVDKESAQTVEMHSKTKVRGWLDELSFSGDIRGRYETFFGRQSPSALGTFDEVDRTRYRLRLRLGATAKVGDWTTGFRLATGEDPSVAGQGSDAVSSNVSFDKFGEKWQIFVDQAYLAYQPPVIQPLKLTLGKMENPFWESDMVFDHDLTPAGLAEQYTCVFGNENSLFFNLSQWVLAEDNITQNNGVVSRGEDAYMLGFQAGHEWKIVPKKLELKQAIAFYDYFGIQDQAAGAANTFNGSVLRNSLKTTAAGTVVWSKDYDVFTINNELRIGCFEKLPITLQGEYINNLATNEFEDGYKIGFKLWDAKKKGEYEIGYWYEVLRADAALSLFSDSDFGSSGANAKGHIVKARYNFTDWASLGFAYWYVQNVDDFIRSSGAVDPGAGVAANNQMRLDNRLQLDVTLKF